MHVTVFNLLNRKGGGGGGGPVSPKPINPPREMGADLCSFSFSLFLSLNKLRYICNETHFRIGFFYFIKHFTNYRCVYIVYRK